MAISPSVVSVGTTATALTNVSSVGDGLAGLSVIIQPAAAIFVGDATVTTSNGYPVAATAQLSIDLENNEILYGVCASGTVSVNVLQTGV